jgi:hypothetical protein
MIVLLPILPVSQAHELFLRDPWGQMQTGQAMLTQVLSPGKGK